VLNDKVEIREGGGGVVDVSDIEASRLSGQMGRALVHVDVLHAEFAGLFQVPPSPGVRQLVARESPRHFGCIELHALQSPPLDVLLEHLEAGFPVPGSKEPLTTKRPGYFSARLPLSSVVLNPFR